MTQLHILFIHKLSLVDPSISAECSTQEMMPSGNASLWSPVQQLLTPACSVRHNWDGRCSFSLSAN